MTSKQFFRKFAAYIILIVGIIFTLVCLVSGIAMFFYFPDAIEGKVIISAIVLIVVSVIIAIVTYVLFDVLREEGEENHITHEGWKSESS